MNSNPPLKLWWHWLTQIKGIGPRKLKVLSNHITTRNAPSKKDMQSSFLHSLTSLSQDELASILKIPSNKLHGWLDQKRLNELNQQELLRQQKQVHTIYPWQNLPGRLEQIYDPPPFLYAHGNGERSKGSLYVAIVGTRHPSHYGLETARRLGQGLAKLGVVVVSGLALGIDAAALRGAHEAGGETISVVGHGLQTIAPTRNRELAKLLCRQGSILSEFEWGTPPRPAHFPRRNRIVAGICHATVVVEAAQRSGALITARLALEQNREVFAVPGLANDPRAFGPNQLIKDGAPLIENADDILQNLSYLAQPNSQKPPNQPVLKNNLITQTAIPDSDNNDLTRLESKILSRLQGDSVTIDSIIEARDSDTASLCNALTMLEIKGKIQRIGNQIRRKSNTGLLSPL